MPKKKFERIDLGKRFEHAFQKRGYNQKRMAIKLGVSQPTISSWCKVPTLEAIILLCETFDMPIYEIFLPDGFIFPDLDPIETEVLQLFMGLSDDLRGAALKAADAVIDGYKIGKEK